MKILICTTPIRRVPTDYPPFSSLALMQSLRLAGYDPYFYDIDGLRPSFEEVVRFFTSYQPDLVGVSAVVSTAYAYTKRLCRALKEAIPDTPIIVGGNLAASAEILLRRAGVDLCCIGEGERTMVEVARAVQGRRGALDRETLRHIMGLAFLDDHGDMVFTGYDRPIPPEEFLDPDYSILEHYSRVSHFIRDPLSRGDFARDPRTYERRRRGQKMATALTAKGCVARCTFCHRWDKGYRHLPPRTIVERMRRLQEQYNVGFFQFGDENFGSDRRLLDELLTLIEPMDILYTVGGVRCRSVDRELLFRMKQSGCVAMYYGMETGSPRILHVMEKNTTLEQNLHAALWTHEAGIYTTYQLVLGMPGEDNTTVDETIAFVKQVTEMLPEPPQDKLSINYIQALPGTPTYEYAREKGLLGKSMDDEEAYLIRISDTDASDASKMINFTDEDYFTVQSWRMKIIYETMAHWYRIRRWKTSTYRLPSGLPAEDGDDYSRGGYFNLRKVVRHPGFYRFGFVFKHVYYAYHVVVKKFMQLPQNEFWAYVVEFMKHRMPNRSRFNDYRSLRRIVTDQMVAPTTQSEMSMVPLRQGR